MADLLVINQLNAMQGDFKLDHIQNAIIDRIVYDDNVPVAYGIVKRMAEAIMLVNPKVPINTRAKAMRELMLVAQVGAKNFGCEQLHCFVKNPSLVHLLERQFNFRKTEDVVMVKIL